MAYVLIKPEITFFEGPTGKVIMSKIMENFRHNINDEIGGLKVIKKIDYLRQNILPKEDVIGYILDNDTELVIRPSGTEAKIKVYLFEATNSSKLEKAIKEIIDETAKI